jgi:hypothetical protein
MRYFKRVENKNTTQLFALSKLKDGERDIQTWNIKECTRHSIPESWNELDEIEHEEFVTLAIETGLLIRPNSPVPNAVCS